MKKIISALLALTILFSFACCGKKDDTSNSDKNGSDASQSQTEESKKNKKNKKPDKKGMNEKVEIEIPLLLVEEQYRNDLDKYAEQYGYEKVKLIEKKQTVEITMTALSHDLLLTRIGITVMSSIGSTFESEEFPYMTGIGEYNDDFSEIEIFVDKKGYEKDEQSSLLPYTISEYCIYYQLYTTRDEYECKITVKDSKTKKKIETKTFNQNNLGKEIAD